jgi:hypothetical protein
MNLSAIVITAIIIFISGCATPTNQSTNSQTTQPRVTRVTGENAIRDAITVKHNDFSKFTTYSGPNTAIDLRDYVSLGAAKKDGYSDIVYLISVMKRTCNDWAYFDTAYDRDGNKLHIRDDASRDFDSYAKLSYMCPYMESIQIPVTRDYLEKKTQPDGILWVEISGRSKEMVFYIASDYIRAFLSVVK